jgi:hypothetical protein
MCWIIGTALVYHSTNRFANIFLENSPMPRILSNRKINRFALNIVSKTLFKTLVSKKVMAGESLQFISRRTSGEEFVWAESLPAAREAFHATRSFLNTIEHTLIPPRSASTFKAALAEWQGEQTPIGSAWLLRFTNSLSEKDKAVTSLMLLAAFGSYMVNEKDIDNFRRYYSSDKDLVEVCFWAIEQTVHKIVTWIEKPFLKTT